MIWRHTAIGLTLLALSCAPKTAPEPTGAPETTQPAPEADQKAAMAQDYLQTVRAIRAGDPEAGLEGLPEDVEFVLAGAEPATVASNREEFIRAVRERQKALESRSGVERVIVPSEDLMIAQGVEVGTHRGEMYGVEPTGESYGVRWLQIIEMEDGKPSRILMVTNEDGMMKQLGLAPGEHPRAELPDQTEKVLAEPNRQNERIAEAAIDAAAENDWSRMERYLAADVVQHRHDLGQTLRGLGEIRGSIEQAPFSDVDVADYQTASAGDWVVAWGTLDARLTGQLGEIGGSGEKVEIFNAHVFRFEDGQIVEAHTYGDPMDVVRQLEGRQTGPS